MEKYYKNDLLNTILVFRAVFKKCLPKKRRLVMVGQRTKLKALPKR
jgi:hypothetical protein